jgi:hypothetical protein
MLINQVSQPIIDSYFSSNTIRWIIIILNLVFLLYELFSAFKMRNEIFKNTNISFYLMLTLELLQYIMWVVIILNICFIDVVEFVMIDILIYSIQLIIIIILICVEIYKQSNSIFILNQNSISDRLMSIFTMILKVYLVILFLYHMDRVANKSNKETDMQKPTL